MYATWKAQFCLRSDELPEFINRVTVLLLLFITSRCWFTLEVDEYLADTSVWH